MSEFLIDLGARDDRAEVGGKAANLTRLIRAGLPVPSGLVLGAHAHADWLRPGVASMSVAVRDALTVALEDLGAPLIARSSAAIEDDPGHAAAGVFASRPADDLEGLIEAVVAVWESARSPTARAYAKARGLDPNVAMAVILQRRVRGRRGVAYTRPPGRPDRDRLLVAIGEAVATCDRRSNILERGPGFDLDPEQVAEIGRAALEAESAISATSGADVEWVIDEGGALWLVQARPIVHPPRADFAAARETIAPTTDSPEVIWRWDAIHNPAPLSPAQIGLVDQVMESGAAATPMRVLGGYLYVADVAALELEPVSAAELWSTFERQVIEPIEQILAAAAGSSLPRALRAYDEIYRIYSHVAGPRLAGARRQVRELVDDPITAARLLGAGSGTLDAALAAAARADLSRAELEAMCAPLSWAWDVAAPTYGDRPWLLHEAVARYRRRPMAADVDVPERVADLAAAVRELAARDDLLFARAQALVRQALMTLASRWQLQDPDWIFYVPLSELCAASSGGWIEPVARRNWERWRAQAEVTMPLAVCNGEPHDLLLPSEPGILRGVGTGGRARGPIARIDSWGPERVIPPGSVALAQTVTPAGLFVIEGAAAIVCEHGGLLDHGAALARELGLPCVVGCTGAWATLADQDIVLVDGEAGLVLRAE